MGYIDLAAYLGTAQKAYGLMTERFVVQNGGQGGTLSWEGTVEVGSLGSDGSYEVSHSGCVSRRLEGG